MIILCSPHVCERLYCPLGDCEIVMLITSLLVARLPSIRHKSPSDVLDMSYNSHSTFECYVFGYYLQYVHTNWRAAQYSPISHISQQTQNMLPNIQSTIHTSQTVMTPQSSPCSHTNEQMHPSAYHPLSRYQHHQTQSIHSLLVSMLHSFVSNLLESRSDHVG